MKNKITTLAAIALITATQALATDFSQGRQLQSASDFSVLASRDRVNVENTILKERLDALLPQLMAETNMDMWLVINREYAEDPVYFTLVPQPTFAARRTTMLVFSRKADGSVERLSVNRYPFGEPYTAAWSGGNLAEQWQALANVITERNPQRIGINVSTDWAVADGLTKALHQQLLDALPKDYASRLVSAEPLVVRWMEQRTKSELEIYPHIVSLARAVIAEAFSAKVITPGVTTTEDVAWYIRQRYEALGLPVWFMPDVNLQRQGQQCEAQAPSCSSHGVIQRGDVLHTDVGICYLKLCTDTQEMGYVLKVNEQDAPMGLKKALARGNQWQDILTSQFKTGRTGNEVLANTIKETKKQGMISSTYTHPLGFVGHAPGPTIGMWDNQGPDLQHGQWPLHANTAYAIEGNIKQQVPEWSEHYVQIKLEQSAYFDGKQVIYLAGRQVQWHLVR